MGFLDKAKAQATAAMAQGQAKVGAMQSNRSEGELYRTLGEATYAAQRRGGAADAVDAESLEHGPNVPDQAYP